MYVAVSFVIVPDPPFELYDTVYVLAVHTAYKVCVFNLSVTSPALYVVPFPSALVFHEHVYPVFDIAGIVTLGFVPQCAYNVPFAVYDVFLNELVIYPFSFIICVPFVAAV